MNVTRDTRTKRIFRRSVGAALATSGAALVLGAGIASAHIEPDPPAVQAGTVATVSFAVEHGCNGSNTTQLELKVPAGITNAKAVDKSGWTTAASPGTVTFTGGNLDASTPADFSITFTAPATAGVIHFPIVQTCAVGETAWIEIAADGAPEPDHPAPAVLVTEGPPTSAQLAPPPADGADATPSTGDSTVLTTGGATAIPATTAITATSATSAAASGSGDGSSSNTGVIVGIAIGAVVVIGGALLLANRRKGSSPTA